MALVSVGLCWVLGGRDCGNANSSAEGWFGVFAVFSTIPALAAIGVGFSLYKKAAVWSWVYFGASLLGLFFLSAFSMAFAWMLRGWW